MKKTIAVSLILVMMLATVGFVIAGKQTETVEEGTRYLVKSNNGILKMMYGIQHSFDSGFTTDLSPGQLKVLEKFGVEVEEVQIYSITARPYCGDGKCHPVLEDADSCAIDCSTTPVEPICGDGICNGDETTESCPEDCLAEPEPTRDCLPSNTMPWGINKVNGGLGGKDVIVAVLDTGVYTNHLDLKENIMDCKDTTKRRIKDGCVDGNGHGTHVSGTILANGGSDGLGIFGVAPEAKLMAIKVLNDQGSGYADDIAEGIRYAVDNSANIISMSLGGPTESLLMKDAIDYATGKGVLVIASAGNSGPALNSIGYPAANPKVVAVAAFWESDNIADFSSRGMNDGNWVIEEREIEFTAPGVYIESTLNDGCYGVKHGTSMAAPHIAGIAARDWTNTASETRTHLQDLAEAYTSVLDYGQTGDDIEAGFGLPIAE